MISVVVHALAIAAGALLIAMSAAVLYVSRMAKRAVSRLSMDPRRSEIQEDRLNAVQRVMRSAAR